MKTWEEKSKAEKYLEVVNEDFKLYGFTIKDILKLRYLVDCYGKTPEDLEKELNKLTK